MESLLRSYRLSKLANVPFDKSLEKLHNALEFIRSVIQKVELRTDKVNYPLCEFYFIGTVCYFEFICINRLDILYCRDKDFWKLLEQKFEYADIEKLFKEVMIEENFKCSARPVESMFDDIKATEEHFSNKKNKKNI